jgi:hypothetical protein
MSLREAQLLLQRFGVLWSVRRTDRPTRTWAFTSDRVNRSLKANELISLAYAVKHKGLAV